MTDRTAALRRKLLIYISDLRSILMRRVYASQYNPVCVVFARNFLHGVKVFLGFSDL